jgi:hypothetical protein
MKERKGFSRRSHFTVYSHPSASICDHVIQPPFFASQTFSSSLSVFVCPRPASLTSDVSPLMISLLFSDLTLIQRSAVVHTPNAMHVPIIAHIPLCPTRQPILKFGGQDTYREIRSINSPIENNRPPSINSITHHIHTRQHHTPKRLVLKSHRIVRPRKERPIESSAHPQISISIK